MDFMIFATDSFFWFSALAGSFLFAIQFLSHILGVDAEIEGTDAGNFHWLSKQTLTSFFMMFGWVGLTCKKQYDASDPTTICIAFLGGCASFFLTVLLFKSAKKLHSPGNVFCIDKAIGKEAIVYQKISKESPGKISLTLNDLTYEIEAISQSEELASFSRVLILKKLNEKIVIVSPIK